MDVHINSLYICVKDMARAVSFYEDLFGQAVSEKDEIYSVFDVHGFRFGLFAFERVNEAHTFGTSCVPSISTESLSALREKLDKHGAAFPLTLIGDNWVGEIDDSEGNRIELTARCKGLLVLVRYRIRDGWRSEFIKELEKAGIASASRAEAGNLLYELSLPEDSDNDVCLTEVWTDEEAQTLHGKTPHYKELSLLKEKFVLDTAIEKRLLR